LCLVLIALALVLNEISENLDTLNGGGWGVFIAPTTKPTVGEAVCRWAHRTVRCATGHCPVHQPCHPTVRVLTVLTIGALSSWAPDRHCSLSGAPSGAALTLRELSAHCSLLQTTVALVSVARLGAPDSPVNFSEVASEKPEAEEFREYDSWCTGHCPVAHRTVRCARPGQSSVSFAPFSWNPNFNFLLVCVEPLAPVEHII
jgi:hypothetical protein